MNEIKKLIKANWIALLISLLTPALFALSASLKIFAIENWSLIISEDTLHYAYSSVVQGFFGLVGFLGMLGIYRLERLEKINANLKKKQPRIREEILQFIFIPMITIFVSLLFLFSVDIFSKCEVFKISSLIFVFLLSFFSIKTTFIFVWRLVK